MRANLVSKEYTGNTTIPQDSNREYFFILMTVGDGTIEFGNVKNTETTGAIPLAEGTYFRPAACPISEIRITGGTYIVVIG